MILKKIIFIFFWCIWGISISSFAQLSGTNLTEYQLGNIPNVAPDNLNTIYDRSLVKYRYKKFQALTMLEGFKSGYANKSYIYPSQLSLNYTDKKLNITLGNFYETIGRGNLLRSFEIPASILEDRAFRTRAYFFRDVIGANLKYENQNFKLKLLAGKPLDNLQPPTFSFEKRRADNIMAVNPELKLKKLKFGSAYMYLENNVAQNHYITNYISGNIGSKWQYFSELSNGVLGDFKSKNTYAWYGSLNYSDQNWGFSLEGKNYKNFLLGAGLNQPPALIREQTYRVLNRSVHVLLPTNESGFQYEMFWKPKENQVFTYNQTFNRNVIGAEFYYVESFFEWNKEINDDRNVKVFFDYAFDDLRQEQNRLASGVVYDFKVNERHKIKLETEFQTFSRYFEQIYNQVYSVTYSPSKKWSISPLLEISNDPFLLVDKNKRIWSGCYLKYNASQNVNFQLFGGSRRGGPSCNAGICYEVLDFKGIEIRSNVRF